MLFGCSLSAVRNPRRDRIASHDTITPGINPGITHGMKLRTLGALLRIPVSRRSKFTRHAKRRDAIFLTIGFSLALAVSPLTGCGVSTFSTDVPTEFHSLMVEKYQGRQAWTRRTIQDEKKNLKIEQDQEVQVTQIGLSRHGSITVLSSDGRLRIVYPFNLDRPLVLEHYEKALLDMFWFEGPDVRYARNKELYGTRIADAIRDHKILKDMSQDVAYLAWGPPERVIAIKRGLDENWEYDNMNLSKAAITFRSGRVVKKDGENIGDTEEAKKRKRFRRSS